jgi:hypothetical protein
MQPIPSGPIFGIALTWLGLFVTIAIGLAFVSFVVVMSVLMLAGVQIISARRIKAIGALMLFIVPALAVVGTIGMHWVRSHETARVRAYHSPSTEVRSASRGSKTADQVQEIRRASGKAVKFASRSDDGKTKPAPSVDDGKTKAAVIVEVEDAPDEPASQTGRAPSQDGSGTVVNGAHQKDGIPAVFELQTPAPVEKLTGILRVRGTASDPPDWAGKEPLPSRDGVLVALSSQRYATIGEAEENVTALAVDYLKKFYQDEYPLRGEWTVPVSVIEQSALNSLVGEVFEKDFGNGVTGKMYRAHLRLDICPALREDLHASWHDQVVARRLTELGGVFGLATLMLATCAGYFRLDSLTAGQYRRRLKLAAASLIAAGSLVTWQVLA